MFIINRKTLIILLPRVDQIFNYLFSYFIVEKMQANNYFEKLNIFKLYLLIEYSIIQIQCTLDYPRNRVA